MDTELLKSLKVLYVEDEALLRDTTVKSLNLVIGNIVVAGDGQEGLQKFQDGEFDLIITDLSMPVMDGIDMIKAIRNINEDIPILVTTAFGSQSSEIEKLTEIGMDAYVMKPIDMMVLVQTIDDIIKKN